MLKVMSTKETGLFVFQMNKLTLYKNRKLEVCYLYNLTFRNRYFLIFLKIVDSGETTVQCYRCSDPKKLANIVSSVRRLYSLRYYTHLLAQCSMSAGLAF